MNQYSRNECLLFWKAIRDYMVINKLQTSDKAIQNIGTYQYLYEQELLDEMDLPKLERFYNFYMMFLAIALGLIRRTGFQSYYATPGIRNADDPATWRFSNDRWVLTETGHKVLAGGDDAFVEAYDAYAGQIVEIRKRHNIL